MSLFNSMNLKEKKQQKKAYQQNILNEVKADAFFYQPRTDGSLNVSYRDPIDAPAFVLAETEAEREALVPIREKFTKLMRKYADNKNIEQIASMFEGSGVEPISGLPYLSLAVDNFKKMMNTLQKENERLTTNDFVNKAIIFLDSLQTGAPVQIKTVSPLVAQQEQTQAQTQAELEQLQPQPDFEALARQAEEEAGPEPAEPEPAPAGPEPIEKAILSVPKNGLTATIELKSPNNSFSLTFDKTLNTFSYSKNKSKKKPVLTFDNVINVLTNSNKFDDFNINDIVKNYLFNFDGVNYDIDQDNGRAWLENISQATKGKVLKRELYDIKKVGAPARRIGEGLKKKIKNKKDLENEVIKTLKGAGLWDLITGMYSPTMTLHADPEKNKRPSFGEVFEAVSNPIKAITGGCSSSSCKSKKGGIIGMPNPFSSPELMKKYGIDKMQPKQIDLKNLK